MVNEQALTAISHANARRFRKPEPSEADLEAHGTSLLEWDGWRSLKTDPVSDTATANAIRAAFRAQCASWHPSIMQRIFRIIAQCVRGKGFGEPGMADRLYIRYEYPPDQDRRTPTETANRALTETLWIEWKKLGGKAAPHQRAWIERERKRGALVWLAGESFACTPEALPAHYRASGLMSKDIR